MTCTCCGGSAPRQCDDHDKGYGVCESCLAKFGRESFCHVDCKVHGPKAKGLTEQEKLFFTRVGLRMAEDKTLTVETASRVVCDDDARIVNWYCGLSDGDRHHFEHRMSEAVMLAFWNRK